MSTVRYCAKTRTFSVIWKDYARESSGYTYPYRRKSWKWRGTKAPTCRERRRRERELAAYALAQEIASAELAQQLRAASECRHIQAVSYLETLEVQELVISHRPGELHRARRAVAEFVAYLRRNYPQIYLHEVRTHIVGEFYLTLGNKGLAYGTLKRISERLSFVFRRIAIRFEASPVKYTNPFAQLRLSDVLKRVEPTRKKALTAQQIHAVLREALSSARLSSAEALQRFCIFYFLAVTGWRLGDVVGLRWAQVDTERRCITLQHAKTTDKNIYTTIYITSFMLDLLNMLRQLECPDIWREYVFGLRDARARHFLQAGKRSAQAFFELVRSKLRMDESCRKGRLRTHAYTIHSLRGSVITHLTEADFSEVKINYLVGHAPRTTEQRHYLSLDSDPEKSTRALLEYMEELISVSTLQTLINRLTQDIEFRI